MPRFLSKIDEKANINFVLKIEKYLCLYNYTLEEYCKRDAVDAAWEKIAKATKDTADNCKERWKNLRTVFVRKRKPPPSESSTKKPYYLNDVMQFISPYVKVQNNDSNPSNLPSPESNNTEKIFDDSQESEVENNNREETAVDQEHEESNKKNSEGTENGREEISARQNKKPKGKKGSEKQNFPSNADEAFMEYFQHKKQKIDKPESSRRCFLLSLVPEVEIMTNAEFRQFRRSILDAIDNSVPSTSRTVTPLSTSSSYSQNYTTLRNATPSTSNAQYSGYDTFCENFNFN